MKPYFSKDNFHGHFQIPEVGIQDIHFAAIPIGNFLLSLTKIPTMETPLVIDLCFVVEALKSIREAGYGYELQQGMISLGKVSVVLLTVEDKEQQYKSNSMKNEEAVRTLDADEEKSQTTSEIEQNQEGHAMPGHCDGITWYSIGIVWYIWHSIGTAWSDRTNPGWSAMPGHCDGESRQEEVETVEQEIKNHFHFASSSSISKYYQFEHSVLSHYLMPAGVNYKI